jgi:hypothetical protein
MVVPVGAKMLCSWWRTQPVLAAALESLDTEFLHKGSRLKQTICKHRRRKDNIVCRLHRELPIEYKSNFCRLQTSLPFSLDISQISIVLKNKFAFF